ncbi:MAG: zinc ABC transporter substrate-binding protein [Parvibaculaceae bacterium]
MTIRLPILAAVLSALLLWSVAARAEELKVVATIKPVHSLVAAIMGTTGTPALLIDGGASPHTFSLKPSHARALAHADIVFWIGPVLEQFLEGPLANLAEQARSVPLLETSNVRDLPVRSGGVWETHDTHDAHGDEHGTAPQDGPSAIDPHIWLDVGNAIALTGAIEEELTKAYPDLAATFAANAERLRDRLTALDREIEATVSPVSTTPYFVFHDAYQYYETRYGLAPLGAVTASPDIRPGARRLTDLRQTVEERGVVCVFAEPQFEPRLLNILVEDEKVRLALLDPLGSDIAAGPDHYADSMRALTASLVGCLSHP